MRVNQELEQLALLRSSDAIEQFIDSILERSADSDDPIYFSDLLVTARRSLPLQNALFQDTEKKYILETIVDEWGNVPNPGEYIERVVERPLKRNRKPIPGNQLSSWKRMGIYDKKMTDTHKFLVDEKGCIHVDAKEALYFLGVFGVHGKTGMPISYHKIPHSKEPVDVPGSDKKLHVHYYRFKEIEKHEWEKLPKRKASTEPKRQSDDYYKAHKAN